MKTNFKIEVCGDCSDFDFLQEKPHTPYKHLHTVAKKNILTFPTKEMKPDHLFCGKFSELDVVCTAQSKNYSKILSNSDFEEAIGSLDPWNFFVGKVHLRRDFMEWWSRNTTIFDSYIRIIVGFHGFTQSVIEIVKKHNQNYGKTQPIILVEATEKILGRNLYSNQYMVVTPQEKENPREWNREDLSIHFDKTRVERIVTGFCKCKDGECDRQKCTCKKAGIECESDCKCKKKCQEKYDDQLPKGKKKKM
jgi:hypothetical protein